MLKLKPIFLSLLLALVLPFAAFSQETKPLKIDLLMYLENPVTNIFEKSLKDGLGKSGLVEDKDYSIRSRSAQGEMSILASLVDSAVMDKSDLIFTMNSPTLQVALQRAPKSKIVFSVLTDPFILGAGKTNTDHLPNLTGTYLSARNKELFEAIAGIKPACKKIGCLVCSSDITSKFTFEGLQKEAKSYNIDLVEQTYDTLGDIVNAAQALSEKGVDSFLHFPDSYLTQTFVVLNKVAESRKLPIFSTFNLNTGNQLLLSVGPKLEKSSEQLVEIALQAIKGTDLGKIPFQNIEGIPVEYYFNEKLAKELGISGLEKLQK